MGGANTDNRIATENDDNKIEVDVTTLDAISNLYNIIPNFIKIELEGYDLQALKGCTNVLKSGKVKLIMVESLIDKTTEKLVSFFKEIKWQFFALDNKGNLILNLFDKSRGNNIFASPISYFEEAIINYN